jgi:uroporphyrinogen III methyltransferase/synthase
MPNKATKGLVYLVGAGPGDPELITAKGLRCIRTADVLIYDYLAAKAFLSHVSAACECIYVGKKGGDHTLSQDSINALIVEKAAAGNVVTRLKGGDPFIFGRGGEEAEVLVEAGIPFEVVPGVTSAIAAPAYAGIPLTHRDYTSTLAFVTGHEDPTKKSSSIDWPSLAKGIGTLVFFMGVKNLPSIVERLVQNGRAPETPVALVRWGTTSRHRTVTGTLKTIVARAKAAAMKAPAIIVVGKVVELRDTLQWFERRPLLGKRIVVTRARAQASDLVGKLTDMGADCLECPTIRVIAPPSWTALDQCIGHIDQYHWLVFTSVNGVHFFFERLFHQGMDARALGHLRTAAIGPATQEELLKYGITTDILPETYQAESVVDAFSREDLRDKWVLLPRAMEARAVLPEELTRMGAKVNEVTAYQTVQASDGVDQLIDGLRQGRIDMVTFTSSSTAKNFKALLPEQHGGLMKGVRVASIGPITAETALSLGFESTIVASEFTISGLCSAIVAHYTSA